MLVVACGAHAPRLLGEPKRSVVDVPPDRIMRAFAVSPDGRWLCYTAEQIHDQRVHLYLRSIESGDEREIVVATGAHSPFFAPDGKALAFFARGGLWKAQTTLETGASEPQRIADAPSDTAGGTWTGDGRIVFAPLAGSGLMAVAAAGGAAAPLTRLNVRDAELEHGWPHALPNGGILFTVSQRGHDPHLEVLTSGGERRRLPVPAVGQAEFVASRHLVYSYLGNLFAVAFDPVKLQTVGVPVAIAKNIQTQAAFGNLGHSGFSVSRTGTLAWVPSSPEDVRSRLVRVDRTGRYTALPAPAEVYQSPRISPDGRRLAVVVRDGVMTREIRVLDLSHPDRVITTLREGDNQSPAWMPDSRRLTFGSNRDGAQKIYTATLNARKPAPLFSIDVSVPRNPAGWARTRALLVLYEIDPIRRRDVMVYRVGESVMPVAASAANERSPTVSPDGTWIAFVSDQSGRDEIYAKRLDGAADAAQVTTSGATEPVATREGLFFRQADAVLFREWESVSGGSPKELFDGVFEHDPGANLAAYDVDPKGQFFVMLKSAAAPRQLRMVVNWSAELAQLVPVR